MPEITDEIGTILNPLGDFSRVSGDNLRLILDFCMPPALFSLRRASRALLNLPAAFTQNPYIDQCLWKICVSNELAFPTMYTGISPPLVPQWICQRLVNERVYSMEMSGYVYKACSYTRLIPFTSLQEIAFNSSYAVANYSLAQRISLAWSYESKSMGEVLLGELGEGFYNVVKVNTPFERMAQYGNISYMMEPSNYYHTMFAGLDNSLNTNLVLKRLASLGVTQAEFEKIPAQIRQFMILDQIVLDRTEIEFLIAKQNKTLFFNENFIDNIKQLIAISPKINSNDSAISYEDTGNLIKPRFSSCGMLYQQGTNRIDYLLNWLKNHLQRFGLYQETDQTAAPVANSIQVNPGIYGHLKQDLEFVISIVQAACLTSEDLAASQANRYNLCMLQAKIDLATATPAEQNAPNTAAANRGTPAVLRFSQGVTEQMQPAVVTEQAQLATIERNTSRSVAYDRFCCIQ